MKFIIEFGVNHLGNKKILNGFINFFCNSSFSYCTFMLHNKGFYRTKPNYYIDPSDMYKIIDKIKKRKKKIGLSVCDTFTYQSYKNLNFDFFKLLSISNTNRELINLIKNKKKFIYISTGLGRVKKSLSFFKKYKKKSLLHTPMTYKSNQLKFNQINKFKDKYKVEVGYSCHNNNINTLYALSYYNPSSIFLYTKHSNNKKIKIPDDQHAVVINDLERVKKNYLDCLNAHKNVNKKYKINIFKK